MSSATGKSKKSDARKRLLDSKGLMVGGVGENKDNTIERLIADSLGVDEEALPVDVEFDDRDFKRAPNFVTFLTSPKFMNTAGWARQLEIGTKLHSEWCPHCSDKHWFTRNGSGYLSADVDATKDYFLERVQLLEYGKCPKCKRTKSQMVAANELPFYSELIGVAGQRSSKSFSTAMLATYHVHMLLKLQKPTQVYPGMLDSTLLHGTFVALTYAQAKDSLWDPFHSMILDSPWFQQYGAFLEQIERERGMKQPIFKMKDQFILYRHRNVTFYPSGPDKRTLRGRTRCWASVDEIGWFSHDADRSKVKTGATEVYASLDNSLMTMRGGARKLIRQGYSSVPTAILANISSPSSRSDKAMSLHRESIGSNSVFGYHHPTWEMNPELPIETFADMRRRKPIEFERDFAANPPLSSNPFFTSPDAIMAACKGANMIAIKHKVQVRKDGSRRLYAEPIRITEQPRASILALDAGETDNSFSLSLIRAGKKLPSKTDDDIRHQLQCPMMCEIIPRPEASLNHNLIYTHLIKPIIEKMNVRLVVADRWQSLKVLQDIEADFGISTDRYSMRLDDLIYARDQLEEGNVKICKPVMKLDEIRDFQADNYPMQFEKDPVAHFILQMLTVQRLGNQVIKAPGLTDDLWRSFALGCSYGFDPEWNKVFDEAAKSSVSRGTGIFLGRSGTGGGAGRVSGTGASVLITRGGR